MSYLTYTVASQRQADLRRHARESRQARRVRSHARRASSAT
jgi:hypothetical protein